VREIGREAVVWPLPLAHLLPVLEAPMAQNPFETIESTHQYLQLLDKVLEEVQQSTEEDLKRIILTDTMVIGRSVEAVHLVTYKIEQLRHHVKASSRILNDLRTMRRLLLGERKGVEQDAPAAPRPS
jgi:hypothetical protein